MKVPIQVLAPMMMISKIFFFMNFLSLKNIFELVSCCPGQSCTSKLSVKLTESDKKGFALKLNISCIDSCGFSSNIFTSPQIETDKPGCNAFEVNLRSVMAFREIGRGHKAMETFSTVMNMPLPMTSRNFNEINNKLLPVYKECAESNQKMAAEEVHDIKGIDIAKPVNCQISVDGSWQKRGYSSLNGVVTAIAHDNSKVIDVIVLSKHCKQCQIWENRKDNPRYFDWKNNHNCQINHTGSAGAMESAGALEIFRSSLVKYNLRYSHYLGDGDTSSFSKIIDAKPYGEDLIPSKLECVGHIQKRLGNRARNLRKSLKSTVLDDGKKIQGKGRLTDRKIDTLQNYFGMAIRQNTNNILNMRNSIIAILYHCSDIANDESRHRFCPKGPESWCRWQTKDPNFKNKVNLPLAIHKVLKPIFQDLSKEELLKKCLHGGTQNANESFNQLIWDRCPKSKFASKKIVELAVYSAVINFNSGLLAFEDVFKGLHIEPGHYFYKNAENHDKARLRSIALKDTDSKKKRRKTLRSIRKGHIDKNKENEGGDAYKAGNFS